MVAWFALVVLMTVPFWWLGSMIGVEPLPGLTLAALAVVCPALASMIMIARAQGFPGVGRFVQRSVRSNVPALRLAGLLAINPALIAVQLLIARAGGEQVSLVVPSLQTVLFLCALFVPAALLEEVGWTGFAARRMLARCHPVAVGLCIGAMWAIWHYPALIQAGRGYDWIAWWTLGTVATRLIMLTYDPQIAGNVMAMTLYHAMINLCWQICPAQGAAFDPKVNALLLVAVAAALAVGARLPRAAGRWWPR